jgi:Amt family ammonium transporter
MPVANASAINAGHTAWLLTSAALVMLMTPALVTWGYSCIMAFVILKAVDALIGLRVPEAEEVLGLDTTQHGEIAYQL